MSIAFSKREEAEKRANEVLAMMDGEGWTIKVWENLFWYYCVSNGPIRVKESSQNLFYAHLSQDIEGKFGAPGFWTLTFDMYHDDPNNVVFDQIMVAQEFVSNCQKTIDYIAGKVFNEKGEVNG